MAKYMIMAIHTAFEATNTSAAGISCAKGQQSRYLLHADLMHCLASSYLRGATAWLRMSFQNGKNGIKRKSFEQ